MAKKVVEKEEVVEEKTERRKSIRSESTKKDVNNRLSRLIGQLNGIKKMIEDDRFCDDILIQLSAVDMSIKSLANIVLENYIYTSVVKELKNDNLAPVAEVIELFKRFQ